MCSPRLTEPSQLPDNSGWPPIVINPRRFGSVRVDLYTFRKYRAHGVDLTNLVFEPPARRVSAIQTGLAVLQRREVLDHLLIFGPRQLERVLWEFIDHYHTARPHQGLGQRTPIRVVEVRSESDTARVSRSDRVGGLIHEYVRPA